MEENKEGLKKEDLSPLQIKELERISVIYGFSGSRSTEGNHKLLQHILALDLKDDIIEKVIKKDIPFYADITTQCLGEVIDIIFNKKKYS